MSEGYRSRLAQECKNPVLMYIDGLLIHQQSSDYVGLLLWMRMRSESIPNCFSKIVIGVVLRSNFLLCQQLMSSAENKNEWRGYEKYHVMEARSRKRPATMTCCSSHQQGISISKQKKSRLVMASLMIQLTRQCLEALKLVTSENELAGDHIVTQIIRNRAIPSTLWESFPGIKAI